MLFCVINCSHDYLLDTITEIASTIMYFKGLDTGIHLLLCLNYVHELSTYM